MRRLSSILLLTVVLVIAMLRAYEEAARPFLEYMDNR